MRSKILFFCFQVVALSLFSEDAAQPTIKKNLTNIPHVWFSEGLVFLKAKESGLAFGWIKKKRT